MKKIVMFLLTALLALGTAGCSTQTNISDPTEENEYAVSSVGTESEQTTTETTEPPTEAPTEPPTEAFRSEADCYLGADLSNIKSGGTIVEDESSIYFVDITRGGLWKDGTIGRICKYDKETQTCKSLTGGGWDNAFFAPENKVPLKYMNLAENGYIYALYYNTNSYNYEIAKVNKQTGAASYVYTSEDSITEMFLVGKQLVFTTWGDGVHHSGIYALHITSNQVTDIVGKGTAPEGLAYYNYQILGVHGEWLYYAFVEENTVDPHAVKTHLERYSFAAKERQDIPLVDADGNDMSDKLNVSTLMHMGDCFYTIKDNEVYLTHLDTGLVEHMGASTAMMDGYYQGKVFMNDTLYLMTQDLTEGVSVDYLTADLKDSGDFYDMKSTYFRGNTIYHMERSSFGRVGDSLLFATEDRMIFLKPDGTETVLDFDN